MIDGINIPNRLPAFSEFYFRLSVAFRVYFVLVAVSSFPLYVPIVRECFPWRGCLVSFSSVGVFGLDAMVADRSITT